MCTRNLYIYTHFILIHQLLNQLSHNLMEEFNAGDQNPKPFPLQMNSNMELFNMGSLEGFNTGFMMPLSNDHGFSHLQHPVFDPLAHFFPSGQGSSTMTNILPEPGIGVNSSPSISGAGLILGATKVDSNKQRHEQNYGGKKRKKISEEEMEKPREVVHVRAKRGQATDSHSLAERLRREKINDKLKCLQDLVPGCYKTMGMAVMLDVIINYIRSLQNQIDFLSMKLSAASLFYDFNSAEAEAMETLQETSNANEGGQTMGEGYGGISQFQNPNFPL